MNLENIEKRPHPYRVPEGYFQELEESILAATVDQEKEAPRHKSLWNTLPKWSYAAAAMVLVALGTILVWYPKAGAMADEDLLAGITDEEIMIYLANYDLNEYEIVGDISSDQFEELFPDETLLDGLNVEEQDLDDLLLEYEALNETLEI